MDGKTNASAGSKIDLFNNRVFYQQKTFTILGQNREQALTWDVSNLTPGKIYLVTVRTDNGSSWYTANRRFEISSGWVSSGIAYAPFGSTASAITSDPFVNIGLIKPDTQTATISFYTANTGGGGNVNFALAVWG